MKSGTKLHSSCSCSVAGRLPEFGSLHAGRTFLSCRLHNVPECNYHLPALNDEERTFITALEQRLANATYNPDAHVPIFWDTETTGTAAYAWWGRHVHRIVQLAAIVPKRFGGQELELHLNPWPRAMSDQAADAIDLRTDQVFDYPTPPQVCFHGA